MVNATSRMVSAISLGVFWRFAPSTIAIMRSTKVSPGLTVTRTTIQSDSTLVPPVTAEKSPPDSRITGADSPVIALSSTEATPSITSPSAGITSPAITSTTLPRSSSFDSIGCHLAPYLRLLEQLGPGLLLQCAQRRGLRLAAAFGERLGEVGEQHREPQPQRHGEDEAGRRLALAAEGLHPQRGREDAADVDDEHHRVAPLHGRRQLLERLDDRRFDQRRIEECECSCESW